jgi:hypothetical protein
MGIKKKTEEYQVLETIAVMAAFLLLLNLFSHQKMLANSAFFLLLIGLFVRPVSRLIARWWLNFAKLLGALNSKIVLSMVFFLIITPLAFVFRFFSQNPLKLKRESHVKTLFWERNHIYARKDFENMW